MFTNDGKLHHEGTNVWVLMRTMDGVDRGKGGEGEWVIVHVTDTVRMVCVRGKMCWVREKEEGAERGETNGNRERRVQNGVNFTTWPVRTLIARAEISPDRLRV